jgi:hypothetical protein
LALSERSSLLLFIRYKEAQPEFFSEYNF